MKVELQMSQNKDFTTGHQPKAKLTERSIWKQNLNHDNEL